MNRTERDILLSLTEEEMKFVRDITELISDAHKRQIKFARINVLQMRYGMYPDALAYNIWRKIQHKLEHISPH